MGTVKDWGALWWLGAPWEVEGHCNALWEVLGTIWFGGHYRRHYMVCGYYGRHYTVWGVLWELRGSVADWILSGV